MRMFKMGTEPPDAEEACMEERRRERGEVLFSFFFFHSTKSMNSTVEQSEEAWSLLPP